MARRCRTQRREISIIPHLRHFVKRNFAQKIAPASPKICAILRYCIIKLDMLYSIYQNKGDTKEMKKKFYMVLDTETATLPFANDLCKDAKQKQKIAIAKPLVYDIGWVIVDRLGNVYKKVNYLVQETFFVPTVFNTAYYCDKRPIYINLLERGEIFTKSWNDIVIELISDLDNCDMISAYNACFDFKKAIPFTERYIYHLYRADYNDWERGQKYHCEKLLHGADDDSKNPDFLTPIFKIRNKEYPMCDLWGIACDRLINIDKYRNYCLENKLLTASALYFKTSAETSFQYLMDKHDFIEDHTALSDAEIEAQILVKALKKGKIEPMVTAFPFRELGTTYDYALTKKRKYIDTVADLIEQYLNTLDDSTNYYTKINGILERLMV